MQALAGLTALACTLAALGAIAAALLFGDRLLGIFDPAYATPLGVAVLVIYCLGTGVDALLGPSGLVLQMAGAQDVLLRIILIVYPLGLVGLAAATFAFGPLGAALGTAGTVAAQALAAWLVAHRQLGIDTSVFGLFSARQAARV